MNLTKYLDSRLNGNTYTYSGVNLTQFRFVLINKFTNRLTIFTITSKDKTRAVSFKMK